MKEDALLSIIGGLIAGLVGIGSNYLLTRLSRKDKHGAQHRLLCKELEDMLRHCRANHAVLKSMDLAKGIPSKMHFEKLRFMDSSILFSADTSVYIESRYTPSIHRLKLEIRNMNLEIDATLNYLNREEIDAKILEEYIHYLLSKTERNMNALQERLKELTDPKTKGTQQNTHTTPIVYDASWPVIKNRE